VKDRQGEPLRFVLEQNYPNPFNPATTIRYQLPSVNIVDLKVFDVLGKEIATQVSGKETAGAHSLVFDGRNLPSGVYFYKFSAGAVSMTKKMLLLK
jgi:glucuronoarabinoxylan endo-1,4-beta-xylanase